MNDNLFSPPGIHQEAESLQSLIAKAKPYVASMAKRQRMDLEDAIPLGRILNRLHERCGHGQWASSLAEIEITDDSARNYMLLAKSEHLGIQSCKSIREALLTISTARSFQQPFENKKLCRPCRIGTPKPNCPECRKMNEPEHPPTDQCPDQECPYCSERDCPHNDPLHYHHDGCPSCPDMTPGFPPKLKPKKPPKPARQAQIREPGDESPNAFLDWFLRFAKAAEKRIEQMSKSLAAPSVQLQAIRETLTRLAERWHIVATSGPKQYEKPYSKPCKECGIELLICQTSKYNWIALEKANGGQPRFLVEGNVAQPSRGGQYRLHGEYCNPQPAK